MNQAQFKVGDVIRVSTRDFDEKKVHATSFEGVVIALRGQKGSRTFTIRKNATAGVAVEKIYPLSSPTIEKITLIKSNNVRRAKLYYLRKKR